MKKFFKKHGQKVISALYLSTILVGTVLYVEQVEMLEKSYRESQMIFEALIMCTLGM